MAARPDKENVIFIDDLNEQYNAITNQVSSIATVAEEYINKGFAQLSDFGSDPVDYISNIIKPLYENSSLPVDISGLKLEGFPASVLTSPGVASHMSTIGFKDPIDEWPTKFREGESDWHRFTGRLPDKIEENQIDSVTRVPITEQAEYKETHVQTRNESRLGVITTVKTAAAPIWEEPESDKKTKYGDNWVWASPGGVTLEMDSTLGAQAFRVTHPSNSFMEINTIGDFIQKTFAARFDIIAKDHNTYVNKNRQTEVHINDDLRVCGEQAIVIDKDKIEINRMNSSLTIFKSYVRNVGEDDSLIVGQNQSINILQKQSIIIGMNKTEIIGMDWQLFAGTSINTVVGLEVTFVAPVLFQVTAGLIMLN